MKTTGYCVCYREAYTEDWRFCRASTYEENEISVAVFESEDEALNFLAEQGFDVDTETQIVPVTVSGRMPK